MGCITLVVSPRQCGRTLWGLGRYWPLLQVQEYIADLVGEHFKGDVETVMRDPILFGDFRMALHEEEERVYEDIQDYEAAKALFQVRAGRCLLRRFPLPGLRRNDRWSV